VRGLRLPRSHALTATLSKVVIYLTHLNQIHPVLGGIRNPKGCETVAGGRRPPESMVYECQHPEKGARALIGLS
jgi:hypothetical protein